MIFMGNKLIDRCLETLVHQGIPEQVDRIWENTKLFHPVNLSRFQRDEQFHVQTRYSNYCLKIIDPIKGKVVVRGGEYFEDETETIFDGSTFGVKRDGDNYVVVQNCLILRMSMVFLDLKKVQVLYTSPVEEIAAYDVDGNEINITARIRPEIEGN